MELNRTIDEHDRQIALSQLTSYDIFTSSCGEAQGSWPYFSVVVLPPKAPDNRERWVGVYPGREALKTDIRQPPGDRKVVCGTQAMCDSICYWYTDEVSKCLVCTVICAVIFSILATPLSLICFAPMIHRMYKAQGDVERDDLQAARQHCRSACQWPFFWVLLWTTIASTIVLVVVAIVPAVVLVT